MKSSHSSSDDEPLDLHDEDIHAITSVLLMVVVTAEFVQSGEVHQLDMTFAFIDQLAPMMSLPSLFKKMTNFTIETFEELINLVCPVIANNARSTGDLLT